MKINKPVGLALMLSAFLIIISKVAITGAAMGISSINYLDFIALAFFVSGILFFIHGGIENLAAETLKRGGVITSTKEIIHLAKKMGYEGKEVREGYQIINHGHPLTVIPHHRQLSPGVSRSILKALSSGESSFRRYAH